MVVAGSTTSKIKTQNPLSIKLGKLNSHEALRVFVCHEEHQLGFAFHTLHHITSISNYSCFCDTKEKIIREEHKVEAKMNSPPVGEGSDG